jgi:signal transduction histidine kinase
MKKLLAAICINLLLVNFAFAGAGTPAEAKAMVEKAVAYIKANGKEAGFTEFNNKKGKFVDRDLYIFATDYKGFMIAHGGNEKLVGQDLIELKDADGVYLIKAMIEVAKTKGTGSVDYKWANPVSGKIEPKTTYVHAMDGYFVACGAYK